MKYKVKLSVKIMLFSCLLLSGVASATDSVTKTLYIDGSEVGVSTVNTALSYPYPRLTIGAEGSRYYPYNGLVGTIDEFAVYGKVLTDANVSAHYNAGNYVTAVTLDNPVLYLRFEDNNSNEFAKAKNTMSADINSTYIGAVTLTTSGHDGNAAVLHGADEGTGDCIDVCDWDLQLSFDDVSVEFWVKTTQNSDYPRLFQHNGDTAEQGSYGAMYSAETNAVGLIGGDATAYINAVLNDNQWHHVVVTYRSLHPASYEAEVMADDPCLYLKFDNHTMPDSSVNHYYVWYKQTSDPCSNVHAGMVRPAAGAIGGRAFYCDNRSTVAGRKTRVITWNNYATTPWRTFPGWSDLRGDYFALTEPDYDFFPKESSDITFELWVKSTPELVSERWSNVFQQIGSNTYEPDAPYMSFADLDDLSGPNIPVIRIGGGSEMWYPGVNAPLDGEWHQIVVTYDENEMNLGHDMGIQLYIDGSLANQVTVVDATNYQAKMGPEFYTLVIGAANNVGYAWSTYGGWIDEFAVYSGVLSSERIAMHYAAWQPKDCAEVWARGLGYEGDFDKDCDVDLTDYALFAQDWALCNDPAGCP